MLEIQRQRHYSHSFRFGQLKMICMVRINKAPSWILSSMRKLEKISTDILSVQSENRLKAIGGLPFFPSKMDSNNSFISLCALLFGILILINIPNVFHCSSFSFNDSLFQGFFCVIVRVYMLVFALSLFLSYFFQFSNFCHWIVYSCCAFILYADSLTPSSGKNSMCISHFQWMWMWCHYKNGLKRFIVAALVVSGALNAISFKAFYRVP